MQKCTSLSIILFMLMFGMSFDSIGQVFPDPKRSGRSQESSSNVGEDVVANVLGGIYYTMKYTAFLPLGVVSDVHSYKCKKDVFYGLKRLYNVEKKAKFYGNLGTKRNTDCSNIVYMHLKKALELAEDPDNSTEKDLNSFSSFVFSWSPEMRNQWREFFQKMDAIKRVYQIVLNKTNDDYSKINTYMKKVHEGRAPGFIEHDIMGSIPARLPMASLIDPIRPFLNYEEEMKTLLEDLIIVLPKKSTWEKISGGATRKRCQKDLGFLFMGLFNMGMVNKNCLQAAYDQIALVRGLSPIYNTEQKKKQRFALQWSRLTHDQKHMIQMAIEQRLLLRSAHNEEYSYKNVYPKLVEIANNLARNQEEMEGKSSFKRTRYFRASHCAKDPNAFLDALLWIKRRNPNCVKEGLKQLTESSSKQSSAYQAFLKKHADKVDKIKKLSRIYLGREAVPVDERIYHDLENTVEEALHDVL